MSSFTAEILEPRRLFSGGYAYEQLASFSASGTAGSAPAGQIAIDKGGNLYGFTSTGGANGTGAAYEVEQGNSTPIVLVSFPAASSGTSFVATGPVIDSAGDLFGVTETGGDSNQDGTVFEIANASNAVTMLGTFNSATTGSSPGGNLVIDSSGDLFGTTANGGANGCGTVWELAKGGSGIVALASISPVTVNGVSQNPGANGIAIDSGGDLFGTTSGNAAVGSEGTVWELPSGSSTIQTVASFGGANGITPVGQIAVDSNGNLFGVTEYGGDNIGSTAAPQGSGVVWELPSSIGQIVTLANLDSASSGEFPIGGVLLDSKDDLFGTTSAGGNATSSFAGDGTVWEIPAHGVSLTPIEIFNGSGGATPRGDLATDAFGNIYGSASNGGAGGAGNVFEMDLGGASTAAAGLSATVTRTTLPSSVAQGASAHGTATIKVTNPTAVPVRGAFTIAVYASTNGAIDSSAIKIGSLTRSIQVPRNGSNVANVTISSFPTSIQGSYMLLAQVVNSSGNASTAVSGPTISVTPAVVSLSEAFTRLTLPTTLVSGGKVKGEAELKITNNGNVLSTGAVDIALELTQQSSDAPPVQIATFARALGIPAGHSATVSLPITSIPAGLDGTYSILAQVSSTAAGDSSAAAISTYTINPPSVILRASVADFRPTELTAGVSGIVSLTITNDGNIPVGSPAASGAFNVSLGLVSQDGAQSFSLGVSTHAFVLNPGQSRTLSLKIPAAALATIPPGVYVITASIVANGTSYTASAIGSQAITVAS